MTSALGGLHQWRRLALVALMPLLSACGSTTARGADRPSPEAMPPGLIKDGQAEVGCGDDGWVASAMSAGLPGILDQSQVEEAFSELLANPKFRGELHASFLKAGPSATPWRVLRVSGDTYTLGLGRWTATGPQKGASVFEMRGRPGGWEWTGGGACHLAPVLAAGKEWVHVTALATGLDRRSTMPEVGVSEQECSSGRDPRPYLDTPIVNETSATVTVYWTAVPPTGSQSCVGSRPAQVRLHLASPLGQRSLLDGSTYPAHRVTRHSVDAGP